MKSRNQECCPTFHPEKWNNKTLRWDEKPFIKASVPALFHRPSKKMLGKKIVRMMEQAEKAKKIDNNKEEVLLLFSDPHAFRSDIFLSVTDKVPQANNVSLSGRFFAKVFDGAFHEVPTFIKQMDNALKEQHKDAREYYVHYAFCPKCAEEEGHNYLVLFAEVN